MPEFRNREELEERVRVLEHENSMLAERAEETLMLGLVSEAIGQTSNVTEMLDLALERISMLKDIPIVACCSVQGNRAKVIQSYLSFTHESLDGHEFSLPSVSDESGVFMNNESPLIHFLRGSDIYFSPNKVLFIPFSTHDIAQGVYVFADRGEDVKRLERLALPLKRITDLLTLSMENRWLLANYKQLNTDLDQQVEERSKSLVESEYKYRALVEGSDAAIMLLDDKHFVDCNAATLRMFNVDSKEEFFTFHPGILSAKIQAGGMDAMTLANQMIAVAIEKGSHRFDWLHKRLDGDVFPADVHLTRVEINHKTMVQAVVIDMSKHMDAEKALRESERKYRNIIENMQDCYYRTDTEGRLVFASPSIQSLMRCAPDEIIGDKLSDFYIDSRGRQKLVELLMASPDGRVDNFETQVRRKDHEVIWLSASSHFVYDSSGSIEGVEGTLRDITELKQMEENFNQAQKMEAIGTLVGGIAHDFNNMLASMVGSLFLIKKKLTERPELVKSIESLEDQSFRAAGMIKQLLAFARKGYVEIHVLSFSALMEEVFELMQRTIPENISVHLEVCDKPLQVNGDSSLLQQVLMNLINNARDAVAHSKEPELTILVDRYCADEAFIKRHADIALGGGFARLRVGDNGCGIEDEQLNHVFEPYFTTKNMGEGTGLGLAMIYGAVKSHQGMIEVDSTVGKGSVFTVYLPLISHVDKDDVKPQDVKSMSGSGETVLFVDDEAAVREVNVELLEMLGYDVLQAENGLQALALLADKTLNIELLLTDVVMPKMGGIELVKSVWSQQPEMPVIFMSGYDHNHLSGISDRMDRVLILQKPFSIDALSHHIRKALNKEISE